MQYIAYVFPALSAHCAAANRFYVSTGDIYDPLAMFASTQALLALEHGHYIFNSYKPFNIAG